VSVYVCARVCAHCTYDFTLTHHYPLYTTHFMLHTTLHYTSRYMLHAAPHYTTPTTHHTTYYILHAISHYSTLHHPLPIIHHIAPHYTTHYTVHLYTTQSLLKQTRDWTTTLDPRQQEALHGVCGESEGVFLLVFVCCCVHTNPRIHTPFIHSHIHIHSHSLTHYHTQTHSQTHTQTLSHAHTQHRESSKPNYCGSKWHLRTTTLPYTTTRYQCTHTHTHTHAYIHTCIRTHIHIHTRTHLHTHMHTYTHVYAHTYIFTHAHTYTHTPERQGHPVRRRETFEQTTR
jgi:hypothetical protein